MGAVLALPITFLIEFLTSQSPALGYYLKWILSYWYVRICQRMAKKRFDLYDGRAENEPIKLGFIDSPVEVQYESPYPESHLQEAADEVFFYGVNSKSETLITRVARGPKQESEAWIYLKLANGKIYELTQTISYQQSTCEKRCFSSGGLQMYYASPMRRWRIFFSGLLRERTAEVDEEGREIYVKFALIWRASSDVFDLTSDLKPSQLANAFAGTIWKGMLPPLGKVQDALDSYSQAGVMFGTVSVGDDQEEQHLYLYGARMRYTGKTSNMEGSEFVQIYGTIPKNGSFIHLTKASIPNVVKNLCYGYIVEPNAQITFITDADVYTRDHFDERRKKNDVTAIFQADISYELIGSFIGEKSHFSSNKGWDGSLTFNSINLQLNVNKGMGVVVEGKISTIPSRIPKKVVIPKSLSSIELPLVVPFIEEIASKSELTGGKGSSLGTLTQISKSLQTFVVPRGFVITTSSYKEFLNEKILKTIKELENVVYGNIEGDVKLVCQKVSDTIIESIIPDDVVKGIKKNIQAMFGTKSESLKFAVRSSATGEDTEQMSAAGQMETFLGVSGLNEILDALKKCWASQFGYVAVQYKWRNGQILNSPMAVVIQEMIPCDVAGVLFTCDPVTGNPSVISITANYGLGESVVSGTEEPDTVTLQRTFDDKLSIKSISIGAKSKRIVIKGDQGTDTEEVPEDKRRECCITEQMAFRLSDLAIKIEKHYRSQRDIEWGIWNNNVYILQSRPVTSGTGETEFEIMHEFDGPIRCENDFVSVCNIGEVMPGATSPLGMDVILRFFGTLFQSEEFAKTQGFKSCKYVPIGILPFYNHMMFTLVDVLRFEETSPLAQANMLAFLGRIVDDPEMFELRNERYGRTKTNAPYKMFYQLFWNLFFAGKFLKKGKQHYLNYRIPIEKYKTSKEIYSVLLGNCSMLGLALESHMFCSQSSTIWNMFLFTVLGKVKGAFDEDVYEDFATVLASCSDVESADVPSTMQSLAFHIARDIKPEIFKAMSADEGLNWLKSSQTVAGEKFKDFIERHGHRCIKEFDIRVQPWGTKPEQLIKMLQNIVGSVSKDVEEKESYQFSKIASQLKVQLGFKARLFLRFLLPQSRRAVQEREGSKSLLIKGIDIWRKGYHHLAKLMVSEGRLPDPDLLFFLTLDEIGALLNTRSPKILARAVQRQRVYPQLDEFLFPEIMKGLPQPMNLEKPSDIPTEDDFKMKGIPVSRGVARGRVRVAITLDEAAALKPGEILLTYCTDIGWTPYFPVLAGVVTELGGLISHGAVVSREYGLPCVAGMYGVTRHFKTGDYVLLDGNKGILQKLSDPNSTS